MPDARFRQPATALIFEKTHMLQRTDRKPLILLHATCMQQNFAELCFYKVGDLAAEP